MEEQKADHKNALRREIILFAVIAFFSIIAVLYLIYKAAFCFDPYYVNRTEGYWPDKILPCIQIGL